MTHLMLGKPEKVMLEKYFPDLWNLFHPKLSEPSISVHPNKQVGAQSTGKLIGIVSLDE
jgi:ubiquitin carboxyl-terminal hydrolase 34